MAYMCSRGNRECDGCGACEPELPKCPVCGEEAEYFYKNSDSEIVGCENCITKVDTESEV